MLADFAHDYNLISISKNGKMLTEIRKGMHGLRQVRKKVNNGLNNI